ncbi:hypothetical protein GYH30_003890 [Glycine max]|uniref:Uncharacterized protein n=1 Tax=Glycine max TaxID=3847 RepID=K7K836_SOYBN|nr:hypothetical protein GYH30_003890 [Glycine max]
MAGLPSQIACGSWQKTRHAIPPWLLFNNTGLDSTLLIYYQMLEKKLSLRNYCNYPLIHIIRSIIS